MHKHSTGRNTEIDHLEQTILNLKRSNFNLTKYQTDFDAAQQQINRLQNDLKEMRQKTHSEQSFVEKETKIRDLETKLEELNTERDELRAALNRDRKTRRHSTHDAMRTHFIGGGLAQDAATQTYFIGGSGRSLPQDASTRTDPTDQLCGCIEMDEKIKTLKRDLLLKECQFNTYKFEQTLKPWHQEKAAMEKQYEELQQKNASLRLERNRLHQQIQQTFSMQMCSGCCVRKVKSDQTTQTGDVTAVTMDVMAGSALIAETNELKLREDFGRMQNKYGLLKAVCQKRAEKIKGLEIELETLRNSISQNGGVSKKYLF